MGSIGSLLNTARSALMTYQSALQTTSQNIANVQNPNYSTQTSNYGTTTPVNHGGHTYGTGVKLDAINQKVNQRLENQLTKALSMKSAFEEQKLYVGMMEDLLTEGTKDSLGTLLNNFWNAWESLSNKPAGKTGQELVFKSGVNLSHRIKAIDTGLKELQVRLDRNIASGVGQVNLLTKKIADLNRAILSSEGTSGHANDLRDKRNALVDELGTYIDIDMVVKDDGSFHINTSGGLPLVSDHLSYPLEMKAGRVLWRGSSANVRDITDIISGGKLGGWLKVRDKALRETCAELDELASNLIWAMNYQHSQGAGAKYFSGPVAGNYSVDGSGRLDSLKYGNRIDYSRDFLMVIKDASSYGIKYQKAGVDMGKSTAGISDINGNGRPGSTYKLTVVDKGRVGEQSVSETSGNLMGGVCADKSGTIADALDKALPDQTLTVKGKNGTKIIKVRDKGGNTGRSAGQTAKSLNDTDGVNAYASSTRAAFSLDGIQQAQDGDIVRFSLYANGVEKTVSFTVDSKAGTLKKQFEQALGAAANEINKTFKNTDLKVDGTVISSKSGATLGIQKFEVVDNAGVALDNFKNFNRDDKVFVTVTANSTPPVKIKVKVDLKDVDTSDSAKVGKAFYEALSDQLKDKPFTVKRDATSGKVILRTTDGSSLDLSAASGDTGNDARISVTALGGSTAVGGNQLDFNGTGKAGAAGVKSTGDYLGFSLPGCERSTNVSAASFVGEAGGSHNACAVITGSVTIKTDPGIQVFSDNTSAAGLFGKSGSTGDGNSIITLGGSGGYGKFDDGDNITFKLDGIDISYTVTAGAAPLTDAEQAQQLYDALNNTLPKDGYKVIRNGTYVTIVRTAEADKPVSITGFSDATGGDAALSVSTGTGKGVQAPKNKTLISNDASRNSVSAVTFGDPATLRWEELDGNGRLTGRSGHTKIDDPGRVEIKADGKVLLSFKVSEGNLVAGNTMRVNTGAGGKPDPLKVEVTGRGNRISDTYKFSVASGGSIPNNGEPIVVNWSSGNDSGSFTLKGGNPPLKAEVDGMTFHFNGGTLVKGDSFYVSTDENGKVPDKGGVDTSSDWHWTMKSFADEFNRRAGGVTARVTRENTLVFDTNPDYCPVQNVTCSGANGIDKANMKLTVLNYKALEIPAKGLQFARNGGAWTIMNDPTGGRMQIVSGTESNEGFKVDLDGDGLGDLEVRFDKPVTGDGSIRMDMVSRKPGDIGFAFAGNKDGDSGLAAALGVNTFFTGSDAGNIGVKKILENGDRIASRMVNQETFDIAANDNANALAMAKTRYKSLSMKLWNCSRGKPPSGAVSGSTLDGYAHTMVSGVGLKSQTTKSALDYSESLAFKLNKQRDSVSAVSLDEEMIRLTAQQQAYQAASKLLKVADEMFKTLLSIR